VLSIEHQLMVRALAPDRANHAFDVSVLQAIGATWVGLGFPSPGQRPIVGCGNILMGEHTLTEQHVD
jgi:hypothetical protein